MEKSVFFSGPDFSFRGVLLVSGPCPFPGCSNKKKTIKSDLIMSLRGKNFISEYTEGAAWLCEYGFEFFGVKFGIRLDDSLWERGLLKAIPVGSKCIPFKEANHHFSLVTKAGKEFNGFYLDAEIAFQFEEFSEALFASIGSKIVLATALLAPPKFFFLHAGAVSVGDVGVIIPGDSYSGKTTLVRDFIRRGARYYTDDCAVLDFAGNLYPFPIPLSVRLGADRHKKRDFFPEEFGAETGREKVPVRLILMTRFAEKGIWAPHLISGGRAVFDILKHFFYHSAVNREPVGTLAFLSNLARNAAIFEGERGETDFLIDWVFDYVRELKSSGR